MAVGAAEEGERKMRKAFLFARVAVLFAAAVLLASCYAPLANQQGKISFGLQFEKGAKVLGTSEVIVLVVNSAYTDAFKETLSLISKARVNGSLSSADQSQLTTDAKQLATSGLVKFGGFPFYQTTMTGTSGSFDIPGVPSENSYFVKLFVFNPGYDFKVENIDQNFHTLLQSENLVFNNPVAPFGETYTTDTAWQNWVPVAGQPATVTAGGSALLNVTLTNTIP
jgi:hypothetical protein